MADRTKGLPAGRAWIFVVASTSRPMNEAVTWLVRGICGQIPNHTVFVEDVLAGGCIVGPDDGLSGAEFLKANDAGSWSFCQRYRLTAGARGIGFARIARDDSIVLQYGIFHIAFLGR